VAGQDERPSSNQDVLWTVITVGLWVVAIGMTVFVVATTLFD
jgi:hypothetical protein